MAEQGSSSVLGVPVRAVASVWGRLPGSGAVDRVARGALDAVGVVSPRGRRLAVYAGAGVLGVAGVVEWPVALTGAAVAWLTQPRPGVSRTGVWAEAGVDGGAGAGGAGDAPGPVAVGTAGGGAGRGGAGPDDEALVEAATHAGGRAAGRTAGSGGARSGSREGAVGGRGRGTAGRAKKGASGVRSHGSGSAGSGEVAGSGGEGAEPGVRGGGGLGPTARPGRTAR
uniref:hypothetical protein n=1 Tax=Streptomyces corallincola TaxID=2851888 RepID=UPI001FE6EBB5|nr:hypothetical protein [Streptomyces corallincola]